MIDKIFDVFFGFFHPIGRRNKIMFKNFDEQTKLYERNTKLTEYFGADARELAEHKSNLSRIKELEIQDKKLQDEGGYFYNV